ncbi:MAG: hypothetical protein ACT4OJ_04835 [Bacteroidota bacterium]
MELHFTPMVQFSLLVKAGGRLREFNFRKLKSPEQETVTVNVCDDRGDRILFNMQKKETDWLITQDNLPAWIKQNETGLRQALEEELRKW